MEMESKIEGLMIAAAKVAWVEGEKKSDSGYEFKPEKSGFELKVDQTTLDKHSITMDAIHDCLKQLEEMSEEDLKKAIGYRPDQGPLNTGLVVVSKSDPRVSASATIGDPNDKKTDLQIQWFFNAQPQDTAREVKDDEMKHVEQLQKETPEMEMDEIEKILGLDIKAESTTIVDMIKTTKVVSDDLDSYGLQLEEEFNFPVEKPKAKVAKKKPVQEAALFEGFDGWGLPTIISEGPSAERFEEPFPLTEELRETIKSFGYEDDIIELSDDEDYGLMAKLKPEVAKKLARTYETFTVGGHGDKRLEDAKEVTKDFVEKVIKRVAGDKADYFDVRVYERVQDRYVGSDSAALYVEIKKHDDSGKLIDEKELEPAALYYSGAADSATSSMESWNWLFWLYNPDSPHSDDIFREMYDYDTITQALDQMAATLDESDFESEIEKSVKEMLGDEPVEEGVVGEMARKVTDEVAAAFKEGKSKKVRNTHTDGKSVFLHGNEIVKKDGSKVMISDAGWPTVTTRERINGVLAALGISAKVSQKAGKQMVNGKEWDGKWMEVGSMAAEAVEAVEAKKSAISREAWMKKHGKVEEAKATVTEEIDQEIKKFIKGHQISKNVRFGLDSDEKLKLAADLIQAGHEEWADEIEKMSNDELHDFIVNEVWSDDEEEKTESKHKISESRQRIRQQIRARISEASTWPEQAGNHYNYYLVHKKEGTIHGGFEDKQDAVEASKDHQIPASDLKVTHRSKVDSAAKEKFHRENKIMSKLMQVKEDAPKQA